MIFNFAFCFEERRILHIGDIHITIIHNPYNADIDRMKIGRAECYILRKSRNELDPTGRVYISVRIKVLP